MKNNPKMIAFMLMIFIATTLGCNLLSQSEAAVTDQLADFDNDFPELSELDLGEMSEWPTYLPSDVPILDGEIRVVMGSPGTKVRIFYEPLSNSQISAYVDLCQENGFEIKYLVFTSEGFVDRSDQKLKAGDYDAVEMTKGEYRIRLEYGSDTATLDIYTPGTTPQAQTTAAQLSWPADITAAVPQPDYCQVRNIANLSAGGYQITCEYQDGELRTDEYLQVLKALSFQETDRLINDQNKIVYLIFEDDTYSVKLNLHIMTITFQIVPLEP